MMKTPAYNLFSFDVVLIDCYLLTEAFLERLKLKWPCRSLSCTPLALRWHLPSSANSPSAHFTVPLFCHLPLNLFLSSPPLSSFSFQSSSLSPFPFFFFLFSSVITPFHLYFKVLEGEDLFISFVSKLLETPLLKLDSFPLALFEATVMIPIRVSSATPGSQIERWPLLLLWRDQSFQKLVRSAACPVILAELLFWVTFLCSPEDPLPPKVGKCTFSPGTVWLIILSGEAARLNKMRSHTSPIESPWERKHVVIPSAHLAHTHAFLMKRCIVSVSVPHFLIGGTGTKRKRCWQKWKGQLALGIKGIMATLRDQSMSLHEGITVDRDGHVGTLIGLPWGSLCSSFSSDRKHTLT